MPRRAVERRPRLWPWGNERSLDRTSHDIAESLRVYGIPCLNAHATVAGASDALDAQNGLHGAVASTLLGKRAEAEQRIRAFVRAFPASASLLRARAERWARTVGIALTDWVLRAATSAQARGTA